MRSPPTALLAAMLMVAAAAPAQDPPAVEAAVASGVRQVQEGDFEAAVATLESATARLRGDPQRVRLLVQADVQLGVAHVALDHTPQAVQAFAEAQALDPKLRLTEDRFSPKVRRAFETAREEVARRHAGPPRHSSRRTALIVGGGAALAAAAAAVIVSGGSSVPSFSGARFGTPVIDCPDGSNNLELPFTILVEAANRSGEPLLIRDATSVVTIVGGTTSAENGFASSKPTTVIPSSIPGKQDVTLQVGSFLLCGNGPGDPGRFNEWSGRVTLNTSAGVFMLDVADRMRVNIP